MKKILFLCHGNICRSPMAEYMLMKMARDTGKDRDLEIASAAVSAEEAGNDIYPPARRELSRRGVEFAHRQARQVTEEDFHHYDMIFVMDRGNLRHLQRLLPRKITQSPEYTLKVRLLMTLTGEDRDVADPWYTGDFSKTYRDLELALGNLISQL